MASWRATANPAASSNPASTSPVDGDQGDAANTSAPSAAADASATPA
jgi:hypothetical protein